MPGNRRTAHRPRRRDGNSGHGPVLALLKPVRRACSALAPSSSPACWPPSGSRRRPPRPRRSRGAQQPRLVARAAGFDDTGSPAPGAPLGGWAAAQWDLTGPFGIRAPEAWDAVRARGRTPGQGVTVAVLDTGVAFRDAGPYRRSPDLSSAHVVRGRDFVTPGTGPYDRNGHGTFVAATIAATPGNAYGMVGVAYGARIMPVRVLNGAGNGSAARVARGMRWAVDHGADVLNVSIELYDRMSTSPVSITSDARLRAAVVYAARHGVVVVAAAGNSTSAVVPSRGLGDDLLFVGASTEHGCLGDYSNYGPGVDLVAPGGGADAELPVRSRLPLGRRAGAQRPAGELPPPALRLLPRAPRPAGDDRPARDVDGRASRHRRRRGAPLGAHARRAPVAAGGPASAGHDGARPGPPGADRDYGAGLLDVAAAVGVPRRR